MSHCFPKPYSRFGGDVKVELDLSNYATKCNAKKAAGVVTSTFAKKIHYICLKSDVDKLDIDKLKTVLTNLNNLTSEVGKLDVDKLEAVPINLKKPSDIIDNDVVKKYHIEK